MADDTFTCPRRAEGPRYDVDGEDTWSTKGTCSYCGSISPAALFEAIEADHEIGPTDKNYKVYVKGDGHHKFYFQHLSEAEKLEFLDLLNQGKIRIGSPGHFYVLPFFAVRASDEKTED